MTLFPSRILVSDTQTSMVYVSIISLSTNDDWFGGCRVRELKQTRLIGCSVGEWWLFGLTLRDIVTIRYLGEEAQMER